VVNGRGSQYLYRNPGEIYQQLLKQNPASTRFKEKVRELELRLRKSGGVSSGESESLKQKKNIERTIRELKEWLNQIQRAKKKSM